MKRKSLLASVFIFIMISISHAAVYEASTLYNSTSRSETIQALFQNRWDNLIDKFFYFDVACKINWVYDFDINTYNAGAYKYEPEELNLVRTYGSMIFALPLGVSEVSPGVKTSDYLLAFSMMGYHYGLTKEITIDRGAAGSETVTDYKHSQFFDDIYAVSFFWRPYIYLHSGIITNREYQPENDGTMEYSDPVSSSTRFFFSSNLLSSFNLQMNATEDKMESFATSVAVMPLVAIFRPDIASNRLLPRLTIGYAYRDEYNDEEYDAVWVKSNLDSSKDTARLNQFTLLISQDLGTHFSIDLFASMQYITQDIYDKQTSEKIDVPLIKESYCMLNFSSDNTQPFWMKVFTGVSWYWDPAIHVHRDRGTGNGLWGWVLGADANFQMFGLNARVVYDYSDELKKLVETSNKWSFDFSAYFRI